jgi:hypothetical protein
MFDNSPAVHLNVLNALAARVAVSSIYASADKIRMGALSSFLDNKRKIYE